MFIEDKIFSKALNKEMKLSLFIPSEYKNIKLPVLYFLHGRTGNHKLIEQLNIETIANKIISEKKIEPFIIVCPDMDNSRGINSSNEYKELKGKYGIVNKGRYEDYLITEVIPYIDDNYNTISNKENRYIGGVSAGGYIALHNGIRHQELFSKVGGHMPAIDLKFEDEDECYFQNENMWHKYNPIELAQNNNIDGIEFYLDDGKQDEGKFYLACEKLNNIFIEKKIKSEFNLFNGHHDSEYIFENLEKYLIFYAKN